MALVSGPTLADAIADPNDELPSCFRENDDAKLIDDLFWRLFNRPSTPEEIATCRNDLQSIDDDHRKLAENLGKREVEFALRRPQLERDRLATITAARLRLAAHEKDLAPRLSLKEKDRAARTAKLEADLKTYEATIPGKLAAWEESRPGRSSTTGRFEPKSLTRDRRRLTKEADGSITVGGTNTKGVLTFVAETDLTDITGVRLEVLADGRLPSKGPGRAPDGNFVLTDCQQLRHRTKATANQSEPVGLQNPLADFSQDGFEVAKAADRRLQRCRRRLGVVLLRSRASSTGRPSRPRKQSASPATASPSNCTTSTRATFISSAGSGCRSPESPSRA